MRVVSLLFLYFTLLGSIHGGIVESISQAILSDESDVVVVSRISPSDVIRSGSREVSFYELLEEQKAERGKVFLLCDVKESVKGSLAEIVFFVQGEEKVRNPHTGIHGFIPDYGTVWIGVASKNKVQNVRGVTAATFSDVTDGVSRVIDGMVDGEKIDDVISDLNKIDAYLKGGEMFLVQTKFAQSVAGHILNAVDAGSAVRRAVKSAQY